MDISCDQYTGYSMAQLQLSTQLINDICNILEKADKNAADSGVASQYLSAITGYLLGQQDMPMDKKEEILEELSAFSLHVVKDIEQQKHQQASAPPAQEAFGTWKPGEP